MKAPFNDNGPPYAQLESHPKETSPGDPVDFDASKSHDAEHKQCVEFVWDFGDGSPQKTTDVPRTKHSYQRTGTYPVTVTVKDKRGQTASASVNQMLVKNVCILDVIRLKFPTTSPSP